MEEKIEVAVCIQPTMFSFHDRCKEALSHCHFLDRVHFSFYTSQDEIFQMEDPKPAVRAVAMFYGFFRPHGGWPVLRSKFPNLQWLHSFSTGVDNLLPQVEALKDIVLTNGRGQFDDIVAEFVILGILQFSKRLALFRQ